MLLVLVMLFADVAAAGADDHTAADAADGVC